MSVSITDGNIHNGTVTTGTFTCQPGVWYYAFGCPHCNRCSNCCRCPKCPCCGTLLNTPPAPTPGTVPTTGGIGTSMPSIARAEAIEYWTAGHTAAPTTDDLNNTLF